MQIMLEVMCPECGNEIHHNVYLCNDGDDVIVNVSSFEQTIWECVECTNAFSIGDIEILNVRDL